MPNVFEPDWEVELPEPWSLRASRVGHGAGAERLGATVGQRDELPEVAEHLDSGKVLVMHGASFAEGVLETYRRGDAVEQMTDGPGG